jgi:hemolysin-activating ACP:hemolysin acyltransferase
MTQNTATSVGAAAPAVQADSINMTMLGEIVWLMGHSPLHKGWSMASRGARMSMEVEEGYPFGDSALVMKDLREGLFKVEDPVLNPPVDLEGASKCAAHRAQLNTPASAD